MPGWRSANPQPAGMRPEHQRGVPELPPLLPWQMLPVSCFEHLRKTGPSQLLLVMGMLISSKLNIRQCGATLG